MHINGKELTPEWIQVKELERTHHVIREMDDLGANFTYKGKSIAEETLLNLPFEEVKAPKSKPNSLWGLKKYWNSMQTN